MQGHLPSQTPTWGPAPAHRSPETYTPHNARVAAFSGQGQMGWWGSAHGTQKDNLLCWLWSSIQKLPLPVKCPAPSAFLLRTLLIPAPKEDVSIHGHGEG